MTVLRIGRLGSIDHPRLTSPKLILCIIRQTNTHKQSTKVTNTLTNLVGVACIDLSISPQLNIVTRRRRDDTASDLEQICKHCLVIDTLIWVGSSLTHPTSISMIPSKRVGCGRCFKTGRRGSSQISSLNHTPVLNTNGSTVTLLIITKHSA